jgi:putative addiction module component (TIGR02574 family)
MMQPDALFQQALLLPANERVHLAEKLLESVDTDEEEDVDEATWSDELKLRMEETRSGKVQGLSWEEAKRIILDDAHDATAPYVE